MRILTKRNYRFEFDGQSHKVPGILVIHDAPDWIVHSTMFKLALSDGTIQVLDDKKEQEAVEEKLEDKKVDLGVKYATDPKLLKVNDLKSFAVMVGVHPSEVESLTTKDPIIAIINAKMNPESPEDNNLENKEESGESETLQPDNDEGQEDNTEGQNPPADQE